MEGTLGAHQPGDRRNPRERPGDKRNPRDKQGNARNRPREDHATPGMGRAGWGQAQREAAERAKTEAAAVAAEQIIGPSTTEWLDIKALGKSLEEKFSAHSAKVVNEEKKVDTETGGDFEEHGSTTDADDLEKDIDEQGRRSLPDPLTLEMDLDIDAEEDSVLSIRPIEDKKD